MWSPIHHGLSQSLLNNFVCCFELFRSVLKGFIERESSVIFKMNGSLGTFICYFLWFHVFNFGLTASWITSTRACHDLNISILTFILLDLLDYPLDVSETITFCHLDGLAFPFSLYLHKISISDFSCLDNSRPHSSQQGFYMTIGNLIRNKSKRHLLINQPINFEPLWGHFRYLELLPIYFFIKL